MAYDYDQYGGRSRTTPTTGMSSTAKAAQARASRTAAQRAAEARRRRAAERARKQREAAAAEQAAAVKARTQAMERHRLRREQYTVKKRDTAATIAKRLKTTEYDIAGQAPATGLRAGQVLSFDVPESKDPRGRDVPGRMPTTIAEEVRGPSLLSPRAQALKEAADIMGQPETLHADPIFGPPQEFGAEGARVTTPEGFDALPESPTTPFQGDPYGREYNREPTGMPARRQQEALEAYEWRSVMQYTTDALRHVFETGDTSALFSGTLPGREGAVLWLNDEMMDAYFDAYGQQAIDKIIGLGYIRTPDGVWVPTTVEEVGYGMGGYGDSSFPAYPMGGGGYEEKYYTKGGSSYRGGKTGGRTRADRQKLFAGSVPRAHWRMG